MASKGFTDSMVDGLVVFATDLLMPIMCIAFAVGVVLRILVYYTVRREDWFAREFDLRISHFMDSDDPKKSYSFYVLTKRLLEKTFYELFELRGIMKRTRLDYVMSPSDRAFLIQAGSAYLVRDTLKQIKFLRYGENHPKFLEIAKSVFQNNPCFTRVFAAIPAAPLNDFLNTLPGLFIVGGIFGTFLGIMKALPELGNMDLNDVEGTKLIMDTFLLKVSFSMSTSIVGIVLSVAMMALNTFLSPERVFVGVVNRFELALEFLWRRSDNNELPENIPNFDEHRDPVEALAEFALNKELSRQEKRPVTADGRKPTVPAAPGSQEKKAS